MCPRESHTVTAFSHTQINRRSLAEPTKPVDITHFVIHYAIDIAMDVIALYRKGPRCQLNTQNSHIKVLAFFFIQSVLAFSGILLLFFFLA